MFDDIEEGRRFADFVFDQERQVGRPRTYQRSQPHTKREQLRAALRYAPQIARSFLRNQRNRVYGGLKAAGYPLLVGAAEAAYRPRGAKGPGKSFLLPSRSVSDRFIRRGRPLKRSFKMRRYRRTSRSTRNRRVKRRYNKSSKKYSSKKTVKQVVMDIMNPPATTTAEVIVSYPLVVNLKHYIDGSATIPGMTTWSIQGELSLLYTQIQQCTNVAAGWPAASQDNIYRIRRNVVEYEVTNLSNTPVFIRPIHWIARGDTSLISTLSILNIWDEFCLVTNHFTDEATAGTALMNLGAVGYYSNQVLSSAFDFPEFMAYCKKWFKITKGKQLLVPPQGQLKFKDVMKPFNFTYNYHLSRYAAGAAPTGVGAQNIIRGKSRGFIFECVGETARGGTAGAAATAHAVALPGYISVHRKFHCEAQVYGKSRRTHSIQALASSPALNTTPVVFGSENNAAQVAV